MDSRKIFYGWYITIACCIGLACGLTSVLTGTFSIFLGPLVAEFGWQPSDLFVALMLATVTVTVASPFIGVLIDRFGAKRMILAGFILEGIVLASFAAQDASLGTLYARYILMTLLGLGTTHVSFARVISLWFDRQRGLALGIALAGLGVGGMIWPLLSQWAIDAYGWRTAYLIVTAVVTTLGFLAIAIIVRDTPAAMGLLPDGAPAAGGAGAKPSQPAGFTLAQTLRQAHFWMMILAFFLVGFGTVSLQMHLVPLLKLRGVDPMRAALALSLFSAALIVGRLAGGMLMDRFFASRVASTFLIGPIVASVLLAIGADGASAFTGGAIAGVLAGLASGAEVNASAYLAGRYFGLRYFSRIYAWYFSAYSIGAGFGPLITAKAVEANGGYSGVLYVLGGLLTLAALLLFSLKPFPKSFPQQGQAQASSPA
ncbi:MAG: MFS transporter [Gammaproteobacteria bacterium]|nr:MFS transporter [Gammaproteobacteria bacterium]